MTHDPKSAELSAAVARLRRAKNGEASRAYGDAPRYQYEKDIGILADAYLATVTADDGEAITEEWLRSVGDSRGCEGVVIGPMTVLRNNGGWQVYTHQSSHWHILATFQTRGQLRQLCRALNIALQPIAQEQAIVSDTTCPVCGGYDTHWPDCTSDHMREALESLRNGGDIPRNRLLEPDEPIAQEQASDGEEA